MQFPIMPDFAMDPVPPYYPNPNAGVGMPLVMPLMAGIGDADGLQINGALFGNLMVAPPPMNFYRQMSMGQPLAKWAWGNQQARWAWGHQ
jgi:hypothetical protein